MNITPDHFVRIDRDVNGNPRYVLHYRLLAPNLTTATAMAAQQGGKLSRSQRYVGCFVFQCYNLTQLCHALNTLKETHP